MGKLKKNWPLFLGLAFIIWVGASWFFQAKIESVTLQRSDPSSLPQHITLPYKQKSIYPFREVPKTEIPSYVYTFHVQSSFYQRAIWQIIPDDCVNQLTINGKIVPLKRYYKKEQLCDVKNGFLLNLNSWLQAGRNTVTLEVSDDLGAMYGLEVRSQLFKVSSNFYSTIFLFLGVSGIWGWVLQKKGFDSVVISLSLLSLYFCLSFFNQTTYVDYTPDWWGHAEYLNYMRAHWSLPPPGGGWQFYQAPLYYILATVVGSIGEFFGSDFIASSRYFSIFCVLLAQLYTLQLIRKIVATKKVQWLCSACFLFWPLFLALTGRISNESLLYALWCCFYFYLYTWYQKSEKKYLICCCVLCALMMLVKVSALVPIGTLGLLILYKIIIQKTSWRYFFSPVIFASFFSIILTLGFSFGRIAYYKWKVDPNMNLLISNIHKDIYFDKIKTTNSLSKFIYFDVKSLVKEPFWSLWDDKTGRQYFLNSFIKSSLWGFFGWSNPNIVIIINIVLSVIVILSLVSLCILKSNPNIKFILICIATILVAQLMNRIINKTIVTYDARFVFPIVGLFILHCGVSIEKANEEEKFIFARTMEGTMMYFSFLTSLFMLLSLYS